MNILYALVMLLNMEDVGGGDRYGMPIIIGQGLTKEECRIKSITLNSHQDEVDKRIADYKFNLNEDNSVYDFAFFNDYNPLVNGTPEYGCFMMDVKF